MSVQYESSEESPLLITGPIDEPEADIRAPEIGSSWFSAGFIVINAALGAALLAFPVAYHRAGGVVTALIVQTVLIAFILGALLILAYCSDTDRSATYQDVVHGMCGRWGRVLCAVCVTLYCFGTCITFLIVIGDQWDKILLFISKDNTFCQVWYMNRKFTITITSLIFILPLCFAKRIDFLKHVSALGVAGILYIGVLVIVKYFIGDYHPSDIKTRPDHWSDVFMALPTICFGYQCHVSAIPVYACMKKRNLKEFTKTAIFAVLCCVLCYSTTAVFGYLTFGGSVSSDILVSYPPTWDVLVGIILLATKIYTTYPILYFCGRTALESFLLDLIPISPERIASGEFYRRIAETLIWFFTTLFLAITIPNIGDVISMLGGLAAIFIFVFPGVCLLSLSHQKVETWTRRKFYLLYMCAIVYIVIGAFVFGLTTCQAIMDDIGEAKIPKPVKPCTDI